MKVLEKILFVVAVFVLGYFVTLEPPTKTEYIEHCVHTGETVWSIATEYADNQVKPFNEFVYSIQHQNKLMGRYIKPGDILIIPLAVPVK